MKIVAPFVMLLVFAAIVAMVLCNALLNQTIVFGFAVLSLSGATLKALPFSEQQSDTYNAPLFRPWPWWRTSKTKREDTSASLRTERLSD
jgi:hypothetical protein